MSSEHYVIIESVRRFIDKFMSTNYVHFHEDIWGTIRAIHEAGIKLNEVTIKDITHA